MYYQSNTAAALQFPYAAMSSEELTALYCRLSRDDELQGDRTAGKMATPARMEMDRSHSMTRAAVTGMFWSSRK